MAMFVRAPERYVGLLEHALRRAIPDERGYARAWFERGTRRPHPAGRAFLAILACACEHLSARRFAEYLSLAQVPRLEEATQPSALVLADADEPPRSGPFRLLTNAADDEASERTPDPGRRADRRRPVVEGTLPQPWKWESLIVESSVIGGDAARWKRRLSGSSERCNPVDAERTQDAPDSPKADRIERDLRASATCGVRAADRRPAGRVAGVGHVGSVAGPVRGIAPRVLRQPDGVIARRAETAEPDGRHRSGLAGEARDVIAGRLADSSRALESRYGRVFVGSPQQARGRTFRVVFVAGLAERMFPQRPHEDPMLLDREMREPLGAGLAQQEDRARAERLLLRLAVGAPTERLWLSYPRIEVAESTPARAQFLRARHHARDHRAHPAAAGQLQESAADEGDAGLAWPAPALPAEAIDDFEHDLSVLRQLLQVEPRASVRGHAHYLLRLNDSLKRSVIARWGRGRSQWTPSDGITRVTGITK